MIDPDELKAQVDAHERRLETVWADDRRSENPWATPVQQQVEAVAFEPPAEEASPSVVEAVNFEMPEIPGVADAEVVCRLDAIEQAIASLTVAVTGKRPSPGAAAIPDWLQAAAGDPHDYDVPDSARMSVKVRVLPTIYARLEQTRARFGLQTMAGTWECLLRLGLAAAERLPAHES
jgi:hypothetical protein